MWESNPHRPDVPEPCFRKGVANTRRMTHQNLFLQAPGVLRGYRDVAHGAKAGGDAIDHLFFPDPPGYQS
jgi:hypothetical protein